MPLPNKHVDTGMGLERLSMAVKGLNSTYETDLFSNILSSIEKLSNYKYGKSQKTDIAFRVIADHIRAIVFTISDGAIPSNNKSGYVVRRILRRAVRYGFSVLNLKEPFLFILAKTVIDEYKDIFMNLDDQESFILKVINEEEKTFLKTLDNGLKIFNNIKNELGAKSLIPGRIAFELLDTYGFPYDLTELIARENNLKIDKKEFDEYLEMQRVRSRSSIKHSSNDWVIVNEKLNTNFVGYEKSEYEAVIIKYREVIIDKIRKFHIVFNNTPFYPESGGQVGDKGFIIYDNEKINIEDTFKENDLIIHLTSSLPKKLNIKFSLLIDDERRKLITKNHSATHLLHSALKEVLGSHISQKGSLVNDKVLRFDFSHFSKISNDELNEVSDIVNKKIFENIPVEIIKDVPIKKAKHMGATALFGEKYGDKVRVVIIDKDFSIELCGGTHVKNTSEIGLFKIISENSISSGVRRIEAVTSLEYNKLMIKESDELSSIKELLKTKDVFESIKKLIDKNKSLEKEISKFDVIRKMSIKNDLLENIEKIGNSNLLIHHFKDEEVGFVKQITFELDKQISNLILLGTIETDNKPFIIIYISKKLTNENLDARILIKKLSEYIEGSGGGQNFLSTAGGKNLNGLQLVRKEGKSLLNDILTK